jgi:hypothetical protein
MFAGWAVSAGGCRAEEPPQVAGGACPPGQFCGAPQCPPGQLCGAPQPGMPAPGAPAPAPAGPPAAGLPCAGDLDFQCPFGRCLGGRCGGCSGNTDCKAIAHCGWTPLGMSCLPGAAVAGPAPAPAPPGYPPPAGGFPPPAGAGSFASARQLCVDRTNQFRASVGARPLQRVTAAEACLDAQAAHDGSVGAAHAAFGRCNEGAQNECPGWAGPPDSMVGPCLKMMFDEGPGAGPAHGHYTNMVDAKYTGVACGFSVLPNGRVWMVQDFF